MDYLIMVIITFGALFVLFAAIGIVRMPDLYLRLSGDICLAWFKFSPNVYIKECDERQRF